VVFDGAPVTEVPTYQLLGRGLAHVLERRRLFPYMTVRENLLLGAYLPALRPARGEALERVLALFPGRSGELLADERLHRVYMGLEGGPGSR
jgi:branched-chain amino acid transport system ATP-binding protein